MQMDTNTTSLAAGIRWFAGLIGCRISADRGESPSWRPFTAVGMAVGPSRRHQAMPAQAGREALPDSRLVRPVPLIRSRVRPRGGSLARFARGKRGGAVPCRIVSRPPALCCELSPRQAVKDTSVVDPGRNQWLTAPVTPCPTH